MVQCKAIDWLFIFIAIVPGPIVVSVFFLDHLSFLVVEELDRTVHSAEPWMLVDLSNCESLLGIDLEETAEQITSFC